MYSLIFSKAGIYAGITLFVVGLFTYSLYTWHYSVIDNLEKLVIQKNTEILAKDIVINNQAIELVLLVENNKVIGFEEYFKGLADANNTTYSDKLIF